MLFIATVRFCFPGFLYPHLRHTNFRESLFPSSEAFGTKRVPQFGQKSIMYTDIF
jgi:hypothetical protein